MRKFCINLAVLFILLFIFVNVLVVNAAIDDAIFNAANGYKNGFGTNSLYFKDHKNVVYGTETSPYTLNNYNTVRYEMKQGETSAYYARSRWDMSEWRSHDITFSTWVKIQDNESHKWTNPQYDSVLFRFGAGDRVKSTLVLGVTLDGKLHLSAQAFDDKKNTIGSLDYTDSTTSFPACSTVNKVESAERYVHTAVSRRYDEFENKYYYNLYVGGTCVAEQIVINCESEPTLDAETIFCLGDSSGYSGDKTFAHTLIYNYELTKEQIAALYFEQCKDFLYDSDLFFSLSNNNYYDAEPINDVSYRAMTIESESATHVWTEGEYKNNVFKYITFDGVETLMYTKLAPVENTELTFEMWWCPGYYSEDKIIPLFKLDDGKNAVYLTVTGNGTLSVMAGELGAEQTVYMAENTTIHPAEIATEEHEKWYHIVLTRQQTENEAVYALYIDGELCGKQLITDKSLIDLSEVTLYLGGTSKNEEPTEFIRNSFPYTQVKLYNRALENWEIKSHSDSLSNDYIVKVRTANLRIVNEHGIIIIDPKTSEKCYAVFDVVNEGVREINGKLILGVYENSKFKQCKMFDFFADAGQVVSKKIDISDIDLNSGNSVKLMLWKDLRGMAPMTESLLLELLYGHSYANEAFENGFNLLWEKNGTGFNNFEKNENGKFALSVNNTVATMNLSDNITDVCVRASFTVDSKSDGRMMLMLRYLNHSWFGEHCYLVGFVDNDTVAIIKRYFNNKNTTEKVLAKITIPEYENGFTGIIEAKAIDNIITLCLNGSEIISVTDAIAPIVKGGTGIFADRAMGSIEWYSATKAEDSLGGDLDNLLYGGYNCSIESLSEIFY